MGSLQQGQESESEGAGEGPLLPALDMEGGLQPRMRVEVAETNGKENIEQQGGAQVQCIRNKNPQGVQVSWGHHHKSPQSGGLKPRAVSQF